MDRENHPVRLSGPSDDQLRLIIDNVPAMVWTARPDGFRDFINRRWLEYTGLNFEQAVGTGFAAVHPEDRPEFLAQWERAVQDGTPIECEIRLRRADGEYFWFIHRIVPFRDESRNVLKWIATITDIHSLKRSEESLKDERKRIETAHRQTEEQYRNVVETATDAVISVDETSAILFANPATTRVFVTPLRS
jgi:PAS domain S-box-containing protein